MNKISQFEFVFILLAYRNTTDIIDTIEDIQKLVSSYKIVIVNSYYDKKSDVKLSNIAKKYDCDFVSVTNKGYGYGNNQGVSFAKKKYLFSYLIIANPDIRIPSFSADILRNAPKGVLCPVIETGKGKNQNPLWALFNPVSEWLMYRGYLLRRKALVFSGIAINKFIREIFLLIFNNSNNDYSRIYAPHGSFLIFPYDTISRLGNIFDDNMFLFSEEMYLARRLRQMRIPTYMLKGLKIHHKQDGSMSLAKIDEHSEGMKSYMYYYEKRKIIDKVGR